MKKIVSTYKNALRGIIAAVSVFILSALPAAAQVNTELENIALGNEDLTRTIEILINAFLGVLALIAVVLIMYGGFVWMTARGNEEEILKAKNILKSAVIGLVIILASWAIVLWIFGFFADEGNGAGGPGGGGGGAGGGGFGGGSDFYVLSTTPKNQEPAASLCALQVRMSADVNTTTVTEDTFFLRLTSNEDGAASLGDGASCESNDQCSSGSCIDSACVGDTVAGTIGFGPGETTNVFSFTPSQDLEINSSYEAAIIGGDDGVLSADPNPEDEITEFSKMDASYTWTFTTGSEKDETPPTVQINGQSPFPADGATDVCRNTVINFDFSEAMLTTSFDDQSSFLLDSAGTTDAPAAPDWNDTLGLDDWNFGGDFDFAQARPASELAEFSLFSTRLSGGDAGNDFAGAVTDLCGNPLDGDADGLAEGGDVDNFIGFDAAAGETEDPITWETGENAECTPVINSINPTFDFYGEDGTGPSLSISGEYLGPHPEVEFGNKTFAGTGFNTCFDNTHLGNVFGNTAVGSACLLEDVQTINTVQTNTPVNADDASIRVHVSGLESNSSDELDVRSPYIRAVDPAEGAVGQYVTIAGENFGDNPGKVYMRSADGTRIAEMLLPEACGQAWTTGEVVAVAPETYVNFADVTVNADGSFDLSGAPTAGTWQTNDEAYIQVVDQGVLYSDLQRFTFSEVIRPNLCQVSPECHDGSAESFSVNGEGFGESQNGSEVAFFAGDETAFLAAVDSWSDGQVDGTTDGAMGQDDYRVRVVDGATGLSSNSRAYEIPCNQGPNVVELNACNADTGLFPAPTPEPNSQNACINANIGILFDQPMNGNSFNASTVTLQQWNIDEGDGVRSDYPALNVQGVIEPRNWEYSANGQTYHGFQFNVFGTQSDPNQDGVGDGFTRNLQPNTWYQLTITDGVTNDQGVNMASPYTMRFRTQDTTDICQVSALDLAPAQSTHGSFFTNGAVSSTEYTASAYTDTCQLLDASTLTFNWGIEDENIGNFGTGAGSGPIQSVYVAGDEEENVGTTTVTASSNEFSDDARFSVDLGFCSSDADCASCSNSFGQQSTCNLDTNHCTPVIKNFTPEDGDQGTWVTINGCMFSAPGGTVYWNESGADARIETAFPDSAQCGTTWSDTQIVAEVPESLQNTDYFIEVENKFSDTTTLEGAGPAYTVNDTIRPGICAIDPDKAPEGRSVAVQGKSLGTEEGTASFLGSDSRIAADGEDTEWQDTVIDTAVPAGTITSQGSEVLVNEDCEGEDCATEIDLVTVQDGFRAVLPGGDVQCTDAALCSNPLNFVAECRADVECATGCCGPSGICLSADQCNTCVDDSDCVDGGQCSGSTCNGGTCTPVITDVYNESGPAGSPVTIMGCYFGSYSSSSSSVQYGGENANLLCQTGWSNTQIITEVPSSLSTGTTNIVVNTRDGLSTDGAQQFEVTAQCFGGAAVPEDGVPLLCDLDPSAGQKASADDIIDGSTIDFLGDNFVESGQANIFSNSAVGDNFDFTSTTKTSVAVPSSATTGAATVSVNACVGNALAFAVECTDSADCPDGYCEDGLCTQNACGFCDPNDTASNVCGGNEGCYLDGDLGQYCCAARPEFVKASPADETYNVCPNRQFSLEFSEAMTGFESIELEVVNFGEITGDDGEVTVGETGTNGVDLLPMTVDTDNPGIIYYEPEDGWAVNTDYRLTISSNPTDDTGVRAAASGLALAESFVVNFKTAANECEPEYVALKNTETGLDSHTFTEPNSTTGFVATMFGSNDQPLLPTDTMSWEYSWYPYEDEDTCDETAWVALSAEEDATDEDEPAAASERQNVESGDVNDGSSAIGVVARPLAGWEGEKEDEASIFTFFCDEDAVWEYVDQNADGEPVDPLQQHFRLIYCTEDGVPALDQQSIISGPGGEDFFRQYLFSNSLNQEQAFGIRVYSNEENLSPSEWYEQYAPNPSSAGTLQIDGYEAVQDGLSYYVAASNIVNGQLFNNMYLFTFNDEDQLLDIADQILSNLRFNTNVSHAECEASDKQKLVRDTKRVNDIGTMQKLANQYYSALQKYPRPKSDSFSSYLNAFTTSVWPSWQGALGNIFGKTMPTDPFNIFYASDNATPWSTSNTPWIYEEGDTATDVNGDDKTDDCENVPEENKYYDENGTCWDAVNNEFFCPANSSTYAWKVDPNAPGASQTASIYARMEYESDTTEEYMTTDGSLINGCGDIPQAFCECYNYGATVSSGGDWTTIQQ